MKGTDMTMRVGILPNLWKKGVWLTRVMPNWPTGSMRLDQPSAG